MDSQLEVYIEILEIDFGNEREKDEIMLADERVKTTRRRIYYYIRFHVSRKVLFRSNLQRGVNAFSVQHIFGSLRLREWRCGKSGTSPLSSFVFQLNRTINYTTIVRYNCNRTFRRSRSTPYKRRTRTARHFPSAARRIYI